VDSAARRRSICRSSNLYCADSASEARFIRDLFAADVESLSPDFAARSKAMSIKGR
jgi:hypothetical protein